MTVKFEGDDLSGMKADCQNARFQIDYLEAQLAANKFNPDRSEFERRFVANAKNLIWELRSQCLQRM